MKGATASHLAGGNPRSFLPEWIVSSGNFPQMDMASNEWAGGTVILFDYTYLRTPSLAGEDL